MKKNKNAVLILLNYGIVVALLLMIAIFSFTSKNFFRTSTMFTILKQVSITGIVCIGQTMVMLTGGIDLSVGSVAGVSAVTAAIFLKSYNLPIPVTCILVLILSLIYGLISGFCVTKLNMPPLRCTDISQRSCIYCYRRSSCIWIYKSIWFFCTGKYCRYSESGYSDNYFVYYLYLCIS